MELRMATFSGLWRWSCISTHTKLTRRTRITLVPALSAIRRIVIRVHAISVAARQCEPTSLETEPTMVWIGQDINALVATTSHSSHWWSAPFANPWFTHRWLWPTPIWHCRRFGVVLEPWRSCVQLVIAVTNSLKKKKRDYENEEQDVN